MKYSIPLVVSGKTWFDKDFMNPVIGITVSFSEIGDFLENLFYTYSKLSRFIYKHNDIIELYLPYQLNGLDYDLFHIRYGFWCDLV